MFRFNLQQFKTDDGCFFKRRNQIKSGFKSNRSNNTSAQFESWVVGLRNFVRKFPYSWVLLNYGSADRGTSGTHIYIYIYFFFFVYEEQWDKYKVFSRVQRREICFNCPWRPTWRAVSSHLPCMLIIKN